MGTTTGLQAADQMQQAANNMPDPQAAAPSGPAPQAAPPTAPQAPQAAQPIATIPSDTSGTYVQPQPRSGVAGMLDSIADMLAGRNTSNQVSIDDNGNRVVTPGAPQSRGHQWAQIGLEALQGATTAAAAPPGPGHTAQGVAAAVQQQTQQQQQQEAKTEQEATDDYQRAQNAKMQKANYQILSRKLISDQLSDQLRSQQGTREQAAFSNQMIDREKTLGSVDLGFVNGPGEIADLGNKDPQLISDYHNGLITAWPVYDAAGKSLGLQVFRRKPDVNGQDLPKDAQVYKFVPGADGKAATLTTYTPSPGSMTTGQADAINMAEYGKYNAWQKAQADNALKTAQTKEAGARTTEAYSAAARNKAQTAAFEQANSTEQVESLAQGLFNGTIDPANLTKRSKSYDAVLTRANAISQQATGHGFDVAKAASDYKFATNPQTQNVLKYLNSLTGSNGKTGNLDLVVQYSRDPKLGLKDLPALNNVSQWAKLQEGHPEVAAYRTALLEVQDQAAKILQGGGAGGGGTSDAKLKQAADIIDKNFSPDQIAGVAATLHVMLGNRKREMIGDNRYLNQWFGEHPAQQQGQQPAAQPGQQPAAQPNPNIQAIQQKAAIAGVPPNAHAAVDASGNVVGYQDATGYHALGAAK